MALCSACKTISISALVCELEVVPDWWEQHNSQSKRSGMVHLRDARQLPLSAASGCPLCAMMRDAIVQCNATRSQLDKPQAQSAWNILQLEDHLVNSPIYLRPNHHRPPAFPDDDVANAWRVRGFNVFVPTDRGILVGQIRLFASKDSPAALSCEVTGRPPLPASDSPEAFQLKTQWLAACLAHHQACRITFSGAVVDESNPPILPTRCIHVGCPRRAISPRLVETKGRSGHYMALSHCWGTPAHKHPLMTTQSTLRSHLAGISWECIPKAHQDAITVTRRLGFKYIWIDSLCIIQDSHADWLYESKRMGTVYENARLTIAASHASDSSQPCFFTRPQRPASIELPHISQSGQHEGSVFADLMPTDYVSISPEFGALATRAWATQEWLLARRMIFYTAECLAWSCKTISQRETGGSFHSTGRNPRWKIIVEKYSARSLTNAGDRLIALEGLRAEMKKMRGNDTYCIGLWQHSMPDQLLWYCVEPAERQKSPLGLPTWTWASTIHGVRFLDINKAKNLCEGFHFDETSKTLSIRGMLRQIESVVPLAMHLAEDKKSTSIDSAYSKGIPTDVPTDMLYALCTNEQITFGWGAFDESSQVDNNIFCFRLMNKRLILPQLGGTKIKYHQDWVLLLRRTSDFAGAFERVGVGVITNPTPWFENQQTTQIHLQ